MPKVAQPVPLAADAVPATSIRRAWLRASGLAARTSASRNRYVDFLRASAICVVVIGHWLMAAPSVERGQFTLSDMLQIAPRTQWLTWIFQVMPIFFLVGGYANAVSWQSARSAGEGYASWVSRRLQRLVRPLVPVLIVWSALAVVARRLGFGVESIQIGSQVAFVPTWFLAVYVLVILTAPATYSLWCRFGIGSFAALVASAVAVDAARLAFGPNPLCWLNYAFVWLAFHQLGYAWRDGRFSGPTRALPWAVGGLAALLLLVGFASYPISMITVPGEALSNSNPPTLALLALGVVHAGVLLCAERPVRRWLVRDRVWTATVLVNGAIMTLYLWHATAMVLLVELAHVLGGSLLAFQAGGATWWATRPLWILALLAILSVFVSVFARFEASARQRTAPPPAAWRSVTGAAAVSAGLVALAVDGIGAPGRLGIRLGVVLLTLVGMALVAVLPRAPSFPGPASRAARRAVVAFRRAARR